MINYFKAVRLFVHRSFCGTEEKICRSIYKLVIS